MSDQISDDVQQPAAEESTILTQPEDRLPECTIADLPEKIRSAAQAMGWPALMPVQATAIPYLLARRDMIVQSRTGSGKTGAFLIPLIMRVEPSQHRAQALVLVPTRELAIQVYREFESLSKGMDVTGVLVYGGVGYGQQLKSLKEGAHVIIGTPGRVLDHLGRRSMNLDDLRVLVLDEADEMLSMGFYPAMRELKHYLPKNRSSWMFSATMPYNVQSLAGEFLNSPEFLSLSAGTVAISTMEHRLYDTPPMEKDLTLMRLIEMENPESAIIFCNMKSDVEYLSTVLKNYGYNADQITGDLQQKERERVMNGIREGTVRFLVATDIAARGIDISDLSHVFQYDVPKDPESYVHRAGRTARAGNTGVGITLVSSMSERTDLKKAARKFNIEFVELPTPTQTDVENRMAERLTVLLENRFHNSTRLQRERMKRFDPLIRALSESEDERMVLNMLLDEIYHQEFHAAPQKIQMVAEVKQPAPPPKSEGGESSEASKKKKRRRKRSGGQGGEG
jgi:ATP-dependent RNA helicase DeaD